MLENNLIPVEQKVVEFNGAELMAFKANNGKVYVGVKWLCDGIGLSEGQRKNQINKIQNDPVLEQGGRKIVLPTQSGMQEVLCIELDFLPLWLAKIVITPTMENEQPEVTNKLIQYQLKVKNVLAQAFIGSQAPTTIEDLIIMQAQSIKEMKMQLAATQQIATTAQQEVSNIKDTIVHTTQDWRKWVSAEMNKIAKALGGTGTEFQSVRAETYRLLNDRAHCDLKKRLKNLKERLESEGASKTRIKAANNLDVIEDDPRLKEIYTIIVKETVISYMGKGSVA